jgi:hypothetical protein
MNRLTEAIISVAVFAVILTSTYQSALACQVDDFYLTKEGALAASTPETLNAAIRLEEEGNKEKLGDLVKNGTVLQLKDNIKVQVLERSFEFKMLKIKFPDEREPYWVKDGSLKQINCN